MKKITIKIASLVLLAFLVIGCEEKKEEEVAPKTNYFVLNETEYELSQAITFENGKKDNAFEFELVIASSGVDFSDIENDGMAGKGDIVYFNMLSSSTQGIEAGTYVFSNNATRNSNTYNEMMVLINYENQADVGDEEHYVGTGDVKVVVDGDTYTIEFDLTIGVDRLKMNGSYTGKITNYLD